MFINFDNKGRFKLKDYFIVLIVKVVLVKNWVLNINEVIIWIIIFKKKYFISFVNKFYIIFCCFLLMKGVYN